MCAILENLKTHFSDDVAMRVYASALLLADKKGCEIDVAVKMVIGATKRIKRNSGLNLTWSQAIEQYETIQDEGQHYGTGTDSALSIEVARINKINKVSSIRAYKPAQATVIRNVAQVLESAQAKAVQAEQEQADVKAWVSKYWASIR